jgi:hypothetical protein
MRARAVPMVSKEGGMQVETGRTKSIGLLLLFIKRIGFLRALPVLACVAVSLHPIPYSGRRFINTR